MTKQRGNQSGWSLSHLTFPEPSRVTRDRVSPPESGIVIKSQPEQMRASQSPPVIIATILND